MQSRRMQTLLSLTMELFELLLREMSAATDRNGLLKSLIGSRVCYLWPRPGVTGSAASRRVVPRFSLENMQQPNCRAGG
jgi:hypothetical protein